MTRYFLLSILCSLVILPSFTSANGGDQRVVDGKYLINLSRAPFTPKVGVQISMIGSFVDLQTNKLVDDDLVVKVRIVKLDGGEGERKFLFEQDNIIVKDGILELAHTFTENGLHEIFFDFSFASNFDIIYKAPDFLIDVQNQEDSAPTLNSWLVSIGIGTLGMIIGFLLSRIKSSKKNS